MELIERFRFQFPALSSVPDSEVNTALEIAGEHRLSGSKSRGDISQCIYAAYLLSLRKRDQADSEHSEQFGFGVKSMRMADETRTYNAGGDRASDLLDPSGYLARYRDMQKEGGIFIASIGGGRLRGCRDAEW